MNYLKRSALIVEPSEYQVPNVIGGTFHYVPILHVLEKLLSHGDIDQHLYEQTCSSSKQEKTVLESICDAEVYGTDTFFLENPDAVAINLYVDEVELCNPLGSKRGKHKVTAVCYVVSNIHSKFRSKQHLIHLALLLKHKYVKEAGGDYTEFMKPLLHDLTVLQLHGIEVAVNGHNRVLKGKLIAVSADNLSAHALGGFQQCFNRGRMCRHCMTDHADIGSCFSESSVVLRTSDAYEYHLAAVSESIWCESSMRICQSSRV